MSDTFRTFIVPAAHVELARALCALDTGGAGMFTTPLSATGQEPATHYGSTGWVPPTLAAASPLAVWEQDADGAWQRTAYEPGRPDAVAHAAAAADPPVPCTVADVEALFAASDVTMQDPWTACGRLGLSICQPPAGLPAPEEEPAPAAVVEPSDGGAPAGGDP